LQHKENIFNFVAKIRERMNKTKIFMQRADMMALCKRTITTLGKGMLLVPYTLVVLAASMMKGLVDKAIRFCKEHTKVAVILGFAFCLLTIVFEYVYFGLKLRESADAYGMLNEENDSLRQADRYDIGFADAMAKNARMVEENK
jgi:hypothetical protein